MIEILKPARYINKELNSVHKEWQDDLLKVVLCFPDIYEIGMSHLGMKIIYGLLNKEKDILCERAFTPWTDMEKKMRMDNENLTSLESKTKLKDFDIVGFSLQYEMNLVDVLNMLDLGGIPIYRDKRDNNDPLVIAGGVCSFNPDVMSDFIDVFVIGDGEEVVLEITKIVKDSDFKKKSDRNKILKELSKLEGVYIPSLDKKDKPLNIKKRIVKDLDNCYFPTDPIVPYIQIVHDRIGIEVMRGCPHKCKFCQACKLSHPLRIRSVKRILEIAEESIKNTGYEEISLLSLSTGDYPYAEELVRKLEERFKPLGVKISLPSMRVRSLDKTKVGTIVKRAGLTFAPESGSRHLRDHLNKKISDEDIIQKSNLALKSGWRKVKLYFMIGLPKETQKDLDAIIELSSKIKNANLSISSFIPKPHSEFESQEMNDLQTLKDKIQYLRTKKNQFSRRKNLRMDFHNPEMARIEGILSRGDKNISQLIYKVWQKGARLQAWGEYFNYSLWEECFEECGIDPETYLSKGNGNKVFPWSFVKV